MMKAKFFLLPLVCFYAGNVVAQRVDYSVVSVPEESGLEFTPITNASDYVCSPQVKRTAKTLSWYSNRILDISEDGQKIAYLSARNNSTNIYIKELGKQGGSVQRTNRQSILDFSYSPDGKFICFSEKRGNSCQVFQTDASSGYVCRQITSSANDYSPIYSYDMNHIFFARQEKNGSCIWSYDIKNNYLSTYTSGMNPCLIEGQSAYYCTRSNGNGKSEIWRIDYSTGVEECVVSDIDRGFSTPVVSPDGGWLLMVGESLIESGTVRYRNTDIYVCRTDGTQLTQITYHAADDLSPVWSKDGKYIYFISQRGNAEGSANVWRMKFDLNSIMEPKVSPINRIEDRPTAIVEQNIIKDSPTESPEPTAPVEKSVGAPKVYTSICFPNMPTQGRVFIDTKLSGCTGDTIRVDSGSHNVKIEKEGYLYKEISVSVERHQIFSVADSLIPFTQEATFPNGEEALNNYLQKAVQESNCKQKGKATVLIRVLQNGMIWEPTVIYSDNPKLDNVAISIVKKMPRWTPASLNGHNQTSIVSIPVVFN